jgi:hypothetical protein
MQHCQLSMLAADGDVAAVTTNVLLLLLLLAAEQLLCTARSFCPTFRV